MFRWRCEMLCSGPTVTPAPLRSQPALDQYSPLASTSKKLFAGSLSLNCISQLHICHYSILSKCKKGILDLFVLSALHVLTYAIYLKPGRQAFLALAQDTPVKLVSTIFSTISVTLTVLNNFVIVVINFQSKFYAYRIQGNL